MTSAPSIAGESALAFPSSIVIVAMPSSSAYVVRSLMRGS